MSFLGVVPPASEMDDRQAPNPNDLSRSVSTFTDDLGLYQPGSGHQIAQNDLQKIHEYQQLGQSGEDELQKYLQTLGIKFVLDPQQFQNVQFPPDKASIDIGGGPGFSITIHKNPPPYSNPSRHQPPNDLPPSQTIKPTNIDSQRQPVRVTHYNTSPDKHFAAAAAAATATDNPPPSYFTSMPLDRHSANTVSSYDSHSLSSGSRSVNSTPSVENYGGRIVPTGSTESYCQIVSGSEIYGARAAAAPTANSPNSNENYRIVQKPENYGARTFVTTPISTNTVGSGSRQFSNQLYEQYADTDAHIQLLNNSHGLNSRQPMAIPDQIINSLTNSRHNNPPQGVNLAAVGADGEAPPPYHGLHFKPISVPPTPTPYSAGSRNVTPQSTGHITPQSAGHVTPQSAGHITPQHPTLGHVTPQHQHDMPTYYTGGAGARQGAASVPYSTPPTYQPSTRPGTINGAVSHQPIIKQNTTGITPSPSYPRPHDPTIETLPSYRPVVPPVPVATNTNAAAHSSADHVPTTAPPTYRSVVPPVPSNAALTLTRKPAPRTPVEDDYQRQVDVLTQSLESNLTTSSTSRDAPPPPPPLSLPSSSEPPAYHGPHTSPPTTGQMATPTPLSLPSRSAAPPPAAALLSGSSDASTSGCSTLPRPSTLPEQRRPTQAPPPLPPRSGILSRLNHQPLPPARSPHSSPNLPHGSSRPAQFRKTEAERKIEIMTSQIEGDMERNPPGDYYGICCCCGERVYGAAEACQAMDRIYHTTCFVCSSCGRTLRGKAFYNVHGKIFCEEDYMYSGFQQTADKCAVCGHLIMDMILQALGKSYHPGCFRCCRCSTALDGISFTVDVEGNIYCVDDYYKKFAPKCANCNQAIIPNKGSNETIRVVSMDRDYHVNCYRCEDCKEQLTDDVEKRCYPLGDVLLCYRCHVNRLELDHPVQSQAVTPAAHNNESTTLKQAQPPPAPYDNLIYSRTNTNTTSDGLLRNGGGPSSTASAGYADSLRSTIGSSSYQYVAKSSADRPNQTSVTSWSASVTPISSGAALSSVTPSGSSGSNPKYSVTDL